MGDPPVGLLTSQISTGFWHLTSYPKYKQIQGRTDFPGLYQHLDHSNIQDYKACSLSHFYFFPSSQKSLVGKVLVRNFPRHNNVQLGSRRRVDWVPWHYRCNSTQGNTELQVLVGLLVGSNTLKWKNKNNNNNSIELCRIQTDSGSESRSGRTELQQMYKKVPLPNGKVHCDWRYVTISI